MNKFSKSIAALIAASQVFTVAFAMNVNTELSGYDFENRVFRVEGSTEYANQPVKLEILKRDMSFDNFDNEDDLLYVAQVYSNDDKQFGFDISVSDIGAFSYRVSELSGSEIYSSGFATYTEETVNETITSYIENSEKTVEQLEQLISDFYPSFDVDMTSFKNLDEEVKSKMLASINETEYEDVVSFKNAVSYNVAVSIVISQEDAALKCEYTESFERQLGIADEEYYKEFKKLDADYKAEILENVSDNEPYDTFGENLKNSFVIFEVDNALWNAVADIMDKYLDCDTKELFDDVSNNDVKEAVTALKEAIADGDIIKAEDMYDYLEDSIPGDDDKKNSGGGSRGSGGSKGSYTVPVLTPENTDVITEVKDTKEKYFEDISDVEWAQSAIDYLYKKGVINGKGENIFAPHDNVTREEFVKMIMLAFDFKTGDAVCSFSDVLNDAWYYPYISSAYSMNIVSGQSETAFGTGSYIKRQDMAQILYNALVKSGADVSFNEELTYADKDDISDYAKNAIIVLSSMKCLNGDENGNVMPQKNSTRAEAAKLIYSVVTTLNK